MAEPRDIRSKRASSLALSFGWIAVLPKLLRLPILADMARGNDSGAYADLVPVFCRRDDEPKAVWVPPSVVGSVFCDDRTHWDVPMEPVPELGIDGDIADEGHGYPLG